MILRKLESNDQNDEEKKDSITKMLILNRYSSILIGYKGSVVKDIASKCRGAKISFGPKSDSRDDQKESVAEIKGELGSRQDAICLLAEKIE